MSAEQQKAEAFVREKLPELTRAGFPVKGEVYFENAPIQLQHWLRVLTKRWELKCSDYVNELHVSCFNDSHGTYIIIFDLTTGQPATEADYKAINQVFGI